ncbi:MAG TPA: putative glycoside hydrolase [Candidatus Baltobacteraceae bacterium]|nr:putative glycoside hydrolase [Candidatus Baltobacteraceae bacterium]
MQPPPTSAPGPQAPASFIDTTGRVGLFQEFDRFMTPAQIRNDAARYDGVWGAVQAEPWLSVHPGMLVSRYFIPQEDRSLLSGHDLAWWQSNHPDWILYACDASGNPTHDLACWGGVDRADVPLDFHNPDVIDYQVRQLNGASAIANGHNALAIDQIVFVDAMVGGNPNFGQSVKPGEFACGIWRSGTFVRRYSGVHDPAWTADMVAFVKAARHIVQNDATLAPYHLKIIINHPLGNPSDPNEQALLQNTDGILDENGYTRGGRYTSPGDANLFRFTTDYLIAAQQRGLAVYVIDSFGGVASTSISQREYAVAAYFMANEGRAYMYMSPSTGGQEHNYPEYDAKIGTPCGPYSGGPYIYYRKFSGGLVVLNSGSLPATAVNAALPSGHSYADIDGRSVTNPLSIASSDGYVLLTSNGCS